MKSMIVKCATALSMCAALAEPAIAQVFSGSESKYASVKGWNVLSFNDSNGVFNSCGAVKIENGNRVLVGQGADGSWVLAVPTNQSGTFGGGILDIDKASIDSQFGFIGGFAYRDLSQQELRMIKAGRQMGIAINGDGPEKWFSLTGSTAAILKATECVRRRGHVSASAVVSTPSNRTPNSGSVVPGVAVGQSIETNCSTVFNGTYRCRFEGLTPKQGYRSSIRVSDVAHTATTLDLDVVSDNEADVWAHESGAWRFMGRWGADRSGACLEPVAQQTAEARSNLGHDAWSLCLK